MALLFYDVIPSESNKIKTNNNNHALEAAQQGMDVPKNEVNIFDIEEIL